MAKIGNFVGQGWLAIGKREAKRIENYLVEQCKQVFGEDYFERFEVEVDNTAWRYTTTGKRYPNVRSMKVYGYVRMPIPEFRNWDGARIKGHTRIEFTIHKDKGGWLEYRNAKGELERDYENCPPFSYDCYVRGDGREIVYSGTQENVIEPRHHYVYGTEIRDLDQTSALYDLQRMTEVCNVKSEYRELWAKRKAA